MSKDKGQFLRWAGLLLIVFGVCWVATNLYENFADSIGFKAIGLGLVIYVLGSFFRIPNEKPHSTFLMGVGKVGLIVSILVGLLPFLFMKLIPPEAGIGIIFIWAVVILTGLVSLVLYVVGRG
ncbi:hypothetical protein IT396_03210 [Candidatus Nomurabacteria bacterium]|nr:hypothetical protein [Candidatus Nomurabacteria bacterium]